MSIEAVLARLDRVIKSGHNKWRTACPVHGGKRPNLIINEFSDGGVNCYCFVCGAKNIEVADALGIDRSEMFASEYKRPVITKQMESEEKQDKVVLMMDDVTPPVTLADKRRVKLAKCRLEGIEAKRNAITESKSVASDVIPF